MEIEAVINIAVVMVISVSTAAYGIMMIHVRYLSQAIKDAHDRLDKHDDHLLTILRGQYASTKKENL